MKSKKLAEDKGEFNRRLAAGKKAFAEKSGRLTTELERLKKAQRENQKEIDALVSSLAKMAGTPGEQSILDGMTVEQSGWPSGGLSRASFGTERRYIFTSLATMPPWGR